MSLLRNKYSFIIFDWDGTLMDSTGRIVSAMQASAVQVGLPVPDNESVKKIIGLSMQAVMDQLFPMAKGELREQLLEEYRYQYVEADPTPTPMFKGALEHLTWLRDKNIKIAVATGKARAGLERVLKEVNLTGFFDLSICADESKSKPNPQMVYELLDKAACLKNETLVVGDSLHDINMANNAGVDSIAVTSGANAYHELSELKPKAIFDNVNLIQDWLQG